jgi:short-subunit dehydrogenase involved in D-alanine esterification of teichoic acids
MSDIVLAEGIYVKRSKGSFGTGATSRECIIESLWYPYRAVNGVVELYPVMDNLQRVLGIMQKISAEIFKEEYTLKDNSKEIYFNLKKTLPK